MGINKDIIIQFFRYLWIAMAVALVFFILSQAFYTKRTLEYNLDFSESISKNITGWYPEQRLIYSQVSSLGDSYDAIAEPLYMKIYTPIDFENINIRGLIIRGDREVKLGLKQKDGSWDYQQIIDNNFDLSFDLENAQIKNNQLEIILSIPDMIGIPSRFGLITTSSLNLANNWKIILSR